MLAGDPDQAQPIADESGHKEGAYKKDGGNKPKDSQDRLQDAPPGSMDTAELVGLGVTFREEFDDAVLLAQRHRLVNPAKENVPDDQCEAYVADAARFNDVTDRMSDLTWTEKDHVWRAKRNCSALLRSPGGAAEVAKFLEAPMLMDTRKQKVKRWG